VNLTDVIGELREALDTITGLRVPEWGVQKVTAPAALINPPERIDYDDTYGRGKDRYPDLEVMILVANPRSWRALQDLSAYTDGAGPHSVKAAIEGYPYTACDPQSVRVAWSEFEVVTYSDVPYLAAIFHIELTGKGE
jgi:hypothetical protein